MKFTDLFKNWEKKEHKNLENDDNTVFGFIFKYLELFLLFGIGFLVYSMFYTFTTFIGKKAMFIDASDRNLFAETLMFGLFFCEILLALSTSYFRKRSEWAKSLISSAVAFIITYFNHQTIVEIFVKLPDSNALENKMLLTNWLIFGLSEIVSFLMNSKGNDNSIDNNQVLISIKELVKNNLSPQDEYKRNSIIYDKNGNEIGFKFAEKNSQEVIIPNATNKRIYKKTNYKEIYSILDKGQGIKEAAIICNCSENTVRRAIIMRDGKK